MSGVYWGLTALYLLGELDRLDAGVVTEWVLLCQAPSGGFGGSERHDAHILYTLSALQILALYDKLDLVDADRVASCMCSLLPMPAAPCLLPLLSRSHCYCPPQPAAGLGTVPLTLACCLSPSLRCLHADVAGLQQPDGSFFGDEWGEVDTRFSYCALNALWLLDRTDAIDVPRAVQYLARCRNFDGGFGCRPGNESHAGQVFTCVAALDIAGRLDVVDRDLLCWW